MLAPRGMDAAGHHHHHHLHLEGHNYHAPPISRTIQYKKVKRSIILSSWWRSVLKKKCAQLFNWVRKFPVFVERKDSLTCPTETSATGPCRELRLSSQSLFTDMLPLG